MNDFNTILRTLQQGVQDQVRSLPLSSLFSLLSVKEDLKTDQSELIFRKSMRFSLKEVWNRSLRESFRLVHCRNWRVNGGCPLKSRSI